MRGKNAGIQPQAGVEGNTGKCFKNLLEHSLFCYIIIFGVSSCLQAQLSPVFGVGNSSPDQAQVEVKFVVPVVVIQEGLPERACRPVKII